MQGLLIVVSGFSGVGKGTIVRELLKRYPDKYELSISATTRKPREGEQDGREYFFIDRETFLKKIDDQAFLEYASYNTNYYGTPKDYVLSKMNEGKNVILEIEVQGGTQVKKIYPATKLVFVVAPSAKELFNRLKGRGTETKEEILCRMKRAVDETEYITGYDTLIVNDDLDRCVEELHALFEKERLEFDGRAQFAAELKNELLELTKEEENAASVL